MLLMKNKIVLNLFIVFFFGFLAKSQVYGENRHISKKIYELSYRQTDKFHNGKKMLSLATNDYERAKASGHMGDALRKSGKTKQAVAYFEKALQYAEKAKFIKEEFMLNCLLTDCYNTVGLSNKADSTLKKAKAIAIQLDEPAVSESLNVLEINFLRNRKRYCEAIPLQKKLFDYAKKSLNIHNDTKSKPENRYINSASSLSFFYVKCNNLPLAEKYENIARKFRKENMQYDELNPYAEMFFFGKCRYIFQNK